MGTRQSEIEGVVERCAWCGTRLAPEMRVVIAGGRFAEWSACIEPLRGQVVRVRTPRHDAPVNGIVPLTGTPAHNAGYDLLFVLCGAACREALDAAIDGGDMMLSLAAAPLPVNRARGATAPRASGPPLRASPRRRPS